MAFTFDRGLAIPVWVLASCGVVLTTPSPLLPSVTALLGVVLMASMMAAVVRRSGAGALAPARSLRPWIGARARTFEQDRAERAEQAHDALDLVRMDDDGGWGPAPDRSCRSDGRAGGALAP